MSLCLDAGALIGIEKGDPKTWKRLEEGRSRGERFVTTATVMAQVWRGNRSQAWLAKVLKEMTVLPFHKVTAYSVGVLLARTGTADVVDASLALAVQRGDSVLTSDPDNIALLLDALGTEATVYPL
ncbi:MAG: hypothetical protein LBR21_06100 [Propionibacteriaceae bacterium]|jgi:predicted nucleic acid-binding protein|nr:hypothetical protein [Propionibacteriaceae bacterium]